MSVVGTENAQVNGTSEEDSRSPRGCPPPPCSALRAFVVTSAWGDASELVFASDRAKAKRMGQTSDPLCDVEWTDLRVRREPSADRHAAQFGEGPIGHSAEAYRIMRDLGWYEIDGGGACDWCERYEWTSLPESQLNYGEDDDGLEFAICAGCQEKQNAGAHPPSERP